MYHEAEIPDVLFASGISVRTKKVSALMQALFVKRTLKAQKHLVLTETSHLSQLTWLLLDNYQ